MLVDEIGERMKTYEAAETSRCLMPRLPACVRLDGKAFHTFTRDLQRPFDAAFHAAMVRTAEGLVQETGARIGYTQSDEITLILYSEEESHQPYMGGRVFKTASVLASLATALFSEAKAEILPALRDRRALFDCRVWNVPSKQEAVNVLVWRELDAAKNSVNSAAQFHFSHKSIQGLSGKQLQEKLFAEKNVNWNDYPAAQKRGTYLRRETLTGRFTAEEIDALPAGHNARKNPLLEVARSRVVEACWPPLVRVANRVEVVFDGAQPREAAQT